MSLSVLLVPVSPDNQVPYPSKTPRKFLLKMCVRIPKVVQKDSTLTEWIRFWAHTTGENSRLLKCLDMLHICIVLKLNEIILKVTI